MKKFDVVVVGGGIAGLTAAIYCTRRALKTVVVTKDIGGQALMAGEVENYPGFENVSGADLTRKVQVQAEKVGAEFLYEEVGAVKKGADGGFVVDAKDGSFEAKAVILAFGKTPRMLGVPGEKEFVGKGVTYCATCDMPLFRSKKVVVVGGGNSAVDAAIVGSEYAEKAYLIHRRDKFTAEPVLIERLNEKENVEQIFDSVVTEIRGDQVVEGVVVETDGKMREIECNGVFIEIGFQVKPEFVADLVKIDERSQVVADKEMQTSCEGVFACGDVIDFPYKQLVISASQGSIAALSAYNFIVGKRAVTADWS